MLFFCFVLTLSSLEFLSLSEAVGAVVGPVALLVVLGGIQELMIENG